MTLFSHSLPTISHHHGMVMVGSTRMVYPVHHRCCNDPVEIFWRMNIEIRMTDRSSCVEQDRPTGNRFDRHAKQQSWHEGKHNARAAIEKVHSARTENVRNLGISWPFLWSCWDRLRQLDPPPDIHHPQCTSRFRLRSEKLETSSTSLPSETTPQSQN